MKFIAQINVMPLKALLDPQGKAVKTSMQNTGHKSVLDVRIGKHITMELEADSKEKAEKLVEDACKKILSNPIMESYEFKVKEA
ncbi:MAG TPA: phosphoribosylformylglycinamidine synthase [Bacteroidales bacterium]|nr:MAG: phosphoribosylformylglycinamidine synthase, purS protein [Bacteroidetes bacterium GWF2_33_38]OFY91874.1 MAG: phosphoribosylformylglycinamidine synthase, purS protein [Bacteroidetes bacterium RIFOXYA2_FULL_33_7]HBF87066.1 phosphoribosylformylglycinamidine synthase [Bacteroidales bacterium]